MGGAAAAGADAQRKILDRYKPIKVLLLGDAGVGKTCVLQRFADGTFVSSTRATVGMDLKRTTIDLDGTGEKVTLQIWDTAGQEMFRSIIASYYRGAHGVVLMYDVTRARRSTRSTAGSPRCAPSADDVVAVLVGNKVDCGTEGRQVDQAAAAAFAAEHGMPYVEVSAKAGVMVNEAFITLVATIAGRADELPTLIKRAKLAGPGSAAKADEARAEQNGTVSLSRRRPRPPARARAGVRVPILGSTSRRGVDLGMWGVASASGRHLASTRRRRRHARAARCLQHASRCPTGPTITAIANCCQD